MRNSLLFLGIVLFIISATVIYQENRFKAARRLFHPEPAPGVFFFENFNDGDYSNGPAWEFVSKSGKMVIGIEGDQQMSGQDWEVSDGVLHFKGNFDGLNFFSKEIDIPAGTRDLVLEFDTVLGGTWAHYNLIFLADSEGKAVFGGGVYCDGYSQAKGKQQTNNGLVIIDNEGNHLNELSDRSIAPGQSSHIKITFHDGDIVVDYNNGQFSHTYKAGYAMLPEIRMIGMTGWQHTGGAEFDNILVRR